LVNLLAKAPIEALLIFFPRLTVSSARQAANQGEICRLFKMLQAAAFPPVFNSRITQSTSLFQTACMEKMLTTISWPKYGQDLSPSTAGTACSEILAVSIAIEWIGL
jgi:hypothetical protein